MALGTIASLAMREPRDHTRGLRKRRYSITRGRLYDITKLIRYRNVQANRSFMPEKEGRLYLPTLAQHLFRLQLEGGRTPTIASMRSGLERWAGWLLPETLSDYPETLDRAIEVAMRHPRTENAELLGFQLKLTDRERTQCKINTIAAFDITIAKREERKRKKKRERDKARAAEKRRNGGIRSRAEYLANCLTAKAPWEADGVSRRTWERRRKRGELLSQVHRPID